jgi:glycosyltransferase involved in cell wall biosynthesis
VVCGSSADEALARAEFKIGHTAVVDNGVDCDHFSAIPRAAEPATVLFMGSLNWRPNQDALRLMLDEILPILRQAEPALRLLVVGRNPPDWLRQRAEQSPAVELAANVPDVRPYLARATVMSVPLRIGGGSRLKILEAMAAGTPVVSTLVGCEGLATRHDVHLRIGDTVAEHAAQLLEAIRQPQRSRAISDNACELVRQQYGWESLSRRLESVWEEMVRYRLGPQTKRGFVAENVPLSPQLAAPRTIVAKAGAL